MLLKESNAGPMLINVLLIVIGVPLAVWCHQNAEVIHAWLTGNRGGLIGIAMLIVAQPGLIWSANILFKSEQPLQRRLPMTLLVFVALAWALPTGVGALLSSLTG